jgi:kumamolisin
MKPLAILLGVLLTLSLIWPTTSDAAERRVRFSNSISAFPAKFAVRAPSTAQLSRQLDINVALPMRNLAELQERIARGEVIPREEMSKTYLPLQADYDAVTQWLKGEGFTITQDDPSHLAVFARGPASLIQKSFQTEMVGVTASDGADYPAARTHPSLPESIARRVHGINGLQPYLKAHRHAVGKPIRRLQPAEVASAQAVNSNSVWSANAPPYTPQEIKRAFNAAGLPQTGAGQKIAILIDTYPSDSDLTTFWNFCGINQSIGNIEKVNAAHSASYTFPAPSGEETLDVEWSSGIAPGAKIRIYATGSLYFSDIDKALATLVNELPVQKAAGLRTLSISLGLGETYLVGSSEFATESGYFAAIASQGVSVFVSSGDAGSTPDETGHDNDGPLQAEYEASDPSVTAVGGTSLYLDASTGARSSEVAWPSSGGGASVVFSRPSWQKGPGVPAGTTRLVPDVSLPADPNTGALVIQYLSPPTVPAAGYYILYYGGTSWSAPTWAGFSAMFNQARAAAGKSPLGLLNPRIYPLIGTNNFYDITSGGNAGGANANGKYATGAGYDAVTGIGSPNVSNLLTTLLASPTAGSFSPQNGPVGMPVVLSGANFNNAYSVTFNGVSAAFTVDSNNQITATVPNGAATGQIKVTNPADAATFSTAFTVTPPPDLTITKSHVGNFTQADSGAVYTITVTNIGAGPTSGAVTVVDTLPDGLTATAMTGAGWSINQTDWMATRSDPLAAGNSYPPLTLRVNVSAAAPSSVTNTAVVWGGVETNAANNVASDPTTIIALTPSQNWRRQYFGTTANSGAAADDYVYAGDGLTNLLKYALNLNPLVPAVSPLSVDVSTGYLRLTVPRNPNANDVIFSVEANDDLTNPGGWSAAGVTVDTSTANLLRAYDSTPVSNANRRFLRLRIIRP